MGGQGAGRSRCNVRRRLRVHVPRSRTSRHVTCSACCVASVTQRLWIQRLQCEAGAGRWSLAQAAGFGLTHSGLSVFMDSGRKRSRSPHRHARFSIQGSRAWPSWKCCSHSVSSEREKETKRDRGHREKDERKAERQRQRDRQRQSERQETKSSMIERQREIEK